MTRKEYLIMQYNTFSSEVLEITKTSIVPSLDNVDLIDVLYYFEYHFGNEADYNLIITQMLAYNNIKLTDSQLELLFPIFLRYITVFKSIK